MQGGQDTCMPPALLPYQVALTAPAFVPRAADVQNAAAFLQRAGAVCTLGASCFLPRRFSRADDQVRAAELTRFLCCGAYDIVLCCRGGYGAARLLPYLDKALLQRARAVLCGYSDITALHTFLFSACGGCGVHGLMAATDFAAVPPPEALSAFVDCFAKPEVRLPLQAVYPAQGVRIGRLLGGNLSVFTSLCGTRFFPDLSGAILLLEEVGEPEYRLDRMLTQLWHCGVFEAAQAVIFGNLSLARQEDEIKFLRRFFDGTRSAVYICPLIGHIKENRSVPLGMPASIAAGRLTVRSGFAALCR